MLSVSILCLLQNQKPCDHKGYNHIWGWGVGAAQGDGGVGGEGRAQS